MSPQNVTTSTTPQEIAEQQVQRRQEKTALAKIKAYAALPAIQERFMNLLGSEGEGRRYVESVIIAVANSDNLKQCTPESIMHQAMRAASLKLSVDPALHQAHLVPYAKTAQLIVDYHGLVSMSENTGRYEIPPNVFEIFKGERVTIDRFSGRVEIDESRRAEERPEEGKGIGWCAYFKKRDGVERWLYMTNEECDKWGQTYNPGGYGSSKSPWNKDAGRERWKMRRKTVLRRMMNTWGEYSPDVIRVLKEEEAVDTEETFTLPSSDVIDAIAEEVREPLTKEQQDKMVAEMLPGVE